MRSQNLLLLHALCHMHYAHIISLLQYSTALKLHKLPKSHLIINA